MNATETKPKNKYSGSYVKDGVFHYTNPIPVLEYYEGHENGSDIIARMRAKGQKVENLVVVGRDYRDLYAGDFPIIRKNQATRQKAIMFKENMEKGKAKKVAQNLASWTDEDRVNADRLAKIQQAYDKTTDRDLKKKLWFVAENLPKSIIEWGKALTPKQVECIAKAEVALAEAQNLQESALV